MEHYDAVIAGGGLAGMMMAAKLRQAYPSKNLLILEKAEDIGGRLRRHDKTACSWSSGLRGLSGELFQYWDKVMRLNAEGADLPMFQPREQRRLGVLLAGKVKEMDRCQAFSPEGAKVFAGAAAMRDWQNVSELLEMEKKELKPLQQNFASAFKGNKRSPAAVVLENLSKLWGVPDLWSCQTKVLLQLAAGQAQPSYTGDWEDAMHELLKGEGAQTTLKLQCRVLAARFSEGQWLIETEQGQFTSEALVVAHSPWEAMQWLPKDHWPSALMGLITRTKPVSLVVLSETLISDSTEELPDIVLIPAEGVQALISSATISFQATLDYELTMQAPAVVKAVKKLKRARKKFFDAFQDLQGKDEYLALLPVAWTHITQPNERRWAQKLEGDQWQSEHLVFCGDAYGAHYHGDLNFIHSCDQAYDMLRSSLS